MKQGPDIARVAALIGDPARANILTALMSGKALTATELAQEAGITRATASTHLKKLEDGGLIALRPSGRHKYITLAGEDVATLLETLMGLAAGRGHVRTRTGPRDPALRKARICYNHLAGEMGVHMYQSLHAKGAFAPAPTGLILTPQGQDRITALGLDLDHMPRSSAPLCRECLDWSARQTHLAGRLGRALLSHFIETGWARRIEGTRIIQFSPEGERRFQQAFR